MDDINKEILTVREVAKLMGVNRQRIRARLKQDAVNKKNGRYVYFPDAVKKPAGWLIPKRNIDDILINRKLAELFNRND